MAHNSIPYGRQNITEEDIQAVVDVLRSDFLTQGPKVQEFETAFAQYVGSKYAVAVSNGTTALHLCALALNVQSGQRVITTPITFVASSNCILYCGGDVEFVDIDPKNYCIDLNKVEDLFKKNPGRYQGVIPVDFAGYPVQMDELRSLTNKYGAWIIEDACHAPGATFTDSLNAKVTCGNGLYSDLTVYSFHPVKHIACGEGGMITTNNSELYQRLLLLRSHGITRDQNLLTSKDAGGWYYEMQALGYNYRIPDMLCALGISQLKRADRSLEARQKIALRYGKELAKLPIVLPFIEATKKHAFHLYVIRTKHRKELYQYLKDRNIFTQVHYIPVHQHPFYVNKYGSQSFEHADAFYEECLSLPIFQSMTDEEQTRVIDSVQAFFRNINETR